jgi:putative ABC transport system permease protein
MGGIETSARVQIDTRVLVFTICVSLFTGIAAGMLPARRSAVADAATGLKEGGRTATSGYGQQRLRHLLVGVEVALSVVLLVAAGLMIRSFFALRNVQTGVRIHNVLTAGISLPETHYNTREQISVFAQSLFERLRALPGVESAGLVTVLPVGGYWSDNTFQIEGHTLPHGQFNLALNRAASPGYFQAAGIPLLAGRTFEYRDGRGFDDQKPRESAVVISESMAKKFWPTGDSLGARIYFDDDPKASRYRVVGIVGDVIIRLGDHVRPMMYTPLFEGANSDFFALLHTSGTPRIVAPELRAAVKALDADVPAFKIRTMDEILGESAEQRSFTALLFASFAGLALLLSAVGLYGVLSYLVSQRSSEMGIRMALGAGRSDIWRLVLVQGLRPALAGTVVGLVGALGLVQVLRGLLFGVMPTDLLTFAAVPLVLLSIAVLACLVPASRAARLDPAVALRTE